MNGELYSEILDVIRKRKEWELRQSAWFRLRHGMQPRQNLPFPGAANLKFKLGDSLIEKLKPFYVQQLYSDDVLASFICMRRDQDAALTSAAAHWFDYKLKQESNFEREIYCAIDQSLESGRVPFKIFWDSQKEQIVFSECDPLYVIVPEWTEEYVDADWLVHVLHYSEDQYRRKPKFNQDEGFIGRITGHGSEDSGEIMKEQNVKLREGITWTAIANEIIVWECYRRDGSAADARWVIDTISPVTGPSDPVAASFPIPFKHGKPPFCGVRYEITKKGVYSSRGVVELTATDEALANKSMNARADWMAFSTNPSFEQTGDVPIPNASNFQRRPGSIMPRGLIMSASTPVPAELSQDLEFARQHAEYRVQMPDLGAGSHLVGGGGPAGQADRVTATQINAVVGMSGQSNDLRARLFRLDLGDIFKMSWSVLTQYCTANLGADGKISRESLVYVLNDSAVTVDPAALHGDYIITPNGSPDSWNKGARLAKAFTLYQTLMPNPFIQKGELTKYLLEHDDPRLVPRLFQNPQALAQTEAEVQENEIVRILNNFPALTHAFDDDKTHCAVGSSFFQQRMQQQQPVTPQQAQFFIQHFFQGPPGNPSHLEQLAQKKDPALRKIQQTMMPIMQILQQLAASPPPNVVPMPGSGPQAGAQGQLPMPGTPQAEALAQQQEQQKQQADIAIKAGNMLAALIKAGTPVTQGDINTVFRQLGLPDLPMPHEAIGSVHPSGAVAQPGAP